MYHHGFCASVYAGPPGGEVGDQLIEHRLFRNDNAEARKLHDQSVIVYG